MFHTVQYNGKFRIKSVLKAVILMTLLVVVSAIMPAYAQTTSEFGHKLHPEKLLENTIGDLQIYIESNKIMVPKSIENLKVISSDTDIIQILEIQEDSSSFTKNIKIKAVAPGMATIALAAQGFSSSIISIEVFNNNNHPTQIMMKVTPDEFSIDGPRYGHVGVQLATTGGLPTIAKEDTIVKIETPNTDIIQLRDSEIIIKEGEYFGVIEFDIIESGTAIIFADVDGMRKVSQTIEMLEPEGPLEIVLRVIPEVYNSYSNADGYAIVQLIDAVGVPVIAEEDIQIKLGVDNPDVSINTSTDFDEVLFDNDKLVIKKGEYSAFTKFSPRPNLGDFTSDFSQTFDMFVSVDDYRASGATFDVLHDEIGSLEGEGPTITEVIPFLTTGKDEIIAVTYFETDIEVSRKNPDGSRFQTIVTVPVMAKNDYELSISSSSANTVKTHNSIMEQGENVALISGKTGTMALEGVEMYVTDNEGVKTINLTPNGPTEDSINLVVEPLIPMVLAGKGFPLIAHLVETDEEDEEEVTTTDEDDEKDPRLGPTQFVENGIITFVANELIDIDPIGVIQNQEYVIIDQFVEEVGSTTVEAQVGKFEGTLNLESYTTDPTKSYMGFIDNMLVNEESLATIQLLDSEGFPVYAKKDTIIELVSNDESVIKIPDNIIIKEGEYFNTFNLETLKEGTAEIAILSEDLPLERYDVSVVDISPILTLDLGGTMNWNERIEATVTVAIPEIQASLSGFQVEWETEGGQIVAFDEVTDSEGVATLNIIANELETVSVSATVSGNGLSSSTLSKSAGILNIPIIEDDQTTPPIPGESTESSTGLPLDNTTMILIIIPVAIGGTIFFLKRTDRLDLITEKIPIGDSIGDKIEGIKEKISDIRNR